MTKTSPTTCSKKKVCAEMTHLLDALMLLRLRDANAAQLRQWHSPEGRQRMAREEATQFDARFCQKGFRQERLEGFLPFLKLFASYPSLKITVHGYIEWLREVEILPLGRIAKMQINELEMLTVGQVEHLYYATIT